MKFTRDASSTALTVTSMQPEKKKSNSTKISFINTRSQAAPGVTSPPQILNF